MQKTTETTCSRCVLNSSFPGISFDESGVCSVCRAHEKNYASLTEQRMKIPEMRKILDRLCADAKKKNKPFDVLVPLSGGKDSMYVLYLAVKELGLKTLAYTLDTGYLTQYAKDNIDRACSILGVEHVYYCMDPQLMRSLFALFMKKTGYFCSICMRAINMATERVASMYDVPLVFGGSAAKVELPTTPEMFQSGELSFVKNVFKGENLPSGAERLLYEGSLKRRIGYRMFWWGSQKRVSLCAWVNLPSYIEWDYETMFRTIKTELGWQAPSGESEEHIDCALHKASAYIHNARWEGSEIPRLSLAGLIMAGQATREDALEQLRNKPLTLNPDDISLFLKDMHMTKEEFDACIAQGPRYVQFRKQQSPVWKAARSLKRLIFS